MARPCTICHSGLRGDIDARLRHGESARSIALDLGVSVEALKRHARAHVTPDEAAVIPRGGTDPLDELVDALRPIALEGRNANLVNSYRLAMAAQAARLANRPAYDPRTDPDWLALRDLFLEVCQRHPEAGRDFAAAIRDRGLA